jgi:hypothetical protein
MSKFKTSIPVDVATIKEQLPERSFVNSVTFSGEAVVIEWENDNFKTPYTFPVEWADPAKIPAGVHDCKNGPAPKGTAPQPAAQKMHPFVSGQQTSSPSPQKAKAEDAPPVKKKPAAK